MSEQTIHTHPIEIIPMTTGHLEEVVAIHLQSFEGFFLSQIGKRFLTCLYHGYCREADLACAYAAIDKGHQDRVIGFVAGSTHSKRFHRRLLVRKGVPMGVQLLAFLCRNPARMVYLIKGVLSRIFSTRQYDPQEAELASVAVAPDYRSTGVGGTLINRFLTEMKQRNVPSVFLTTDAHDNDAVNRFYEKNGWRLEHQYSLPNGREMNLYRFYF